MTLEKKHIALLGKAQGLRKADMEGMELCFEVLSLASAIDRDCALRLAPHGLSESRFLLLALLDDRPDGLPPHELADAAGVTRATITGLLDGLERDGFVSRRPSLEDRRKTSVSLTPRGQSTLARLLDDHTTWIVSLLSDLGSEERQLLSALLKTIWRRTDAGRPSPD